MNISQKNEVITNKISNEIIKAADTIVKVILVEDDIINKDNINIFVEKENINQTNYSDNKDGQEENYIGKTTLAVANSIQKANEKGENYCLVLESRQAINKVQDANVLDIPKDADEATDMFDINFNDCSVDNYIKI